MNYCLLVMDRAGMMKMATGEGSPLRQGAGTGSRLVFGGYRGLRPELPIYGSPGCFRDIWVYIGGRSRSVELQGAHEGGVHAQGGRRASLPRGLLASFLTSTPSPLDHVCSKNNSPEGFIPFGFRLIFLFYETLI